MPQRICSRKAPLLKNQTQRISKKNLKLSLNGSKNNFNSPKLSTPSSVITKVKKSETFIEGKWKVPPEKMRNTDNGKLKVSKHLASQNDVHATKMYSNNTSGNSIGK